MGEPPYAKCLRLVRSYFLRSANWVSKLIMVGTNTVWLTCSRSTVSQKFWGLNLGIVT